MRRALVSAALLSVAATALLAPSLDAKGPNRAGLVIDTGAGEPIHMCVFFDEEKITGEQLLDRSRIDLVTDANSLGTAVCDIEGTGCKSDDCFCRYPTFWGYWVRDDASGWRFSDVGASDRTIRNGSLDAWSWGRDGKPAPSADITFGTVCGADAAARRSSQPRTTSAEAVPSNYVTFGGFVALFVGSAAVAYRFRRRLRRR